MSESDSKVPEPSSEARLRGSVAAFIAVLLLASPPAPVFAKPGDLDPTFGEDGRVTTNFADPHGSSDWAYALAIQEDDRIVAAGHTGIPARFALARYNLDGALDKSFDEDGKVRTVFSGRAAGVHGIAVREDGKLIAAGAAGGDFALAGYKSDGSLDESFGDDGRVVTPVSKSQYDGIEDVEVQADGKLVVAGWLRELGNSSRMVVARYQENGELDESFGKVGKALTEIVTPASVPLGLGALELQADGKVVVVGEVLGKITSLDFAIFRLESDGTADDSFGQGGLVTTKISEFVDRIEDLTIMKDGRLVAVGIGNAGYPIGDDRGSFAYARYNPDGTLDKSFSDDGRLIAPAAGDFYDSARAVEVQDDGKVIAAGSSDTRLSQLDFDFTLERVNPDGTLDEGFGRGGVVTTPFFWPNRGVDAAQAVALQSDGMIVAAGYADSERSVNTKDFGLARYEGGD